MTTITLTREVDFECSLDEFDDDVLINELNVRGHGHVSPEDFPIQYFIELVNLGQDSAALGLMYEACIEQAGRVPVRNFPNTPQQRLAA